MITTKPVDGISAQATPFSFQDWRNGFIRRILRIALFIGAAFLLATYLTTTATILLEIYTTLFAILLIANFAPLRYKIRSLIFLTTLFALGVSGLMENGLRGDARVWLMAFVAVTTMLFGNRASIIANGASALVMILFGWLILSGRITLINTAIDIGSLDMWAVSILENVGISALIAAGTTWLERDFRRSQQSASQAFDALRQEREGLENQVTERTAALEHKAAQLQAASLVARETATQQDLGKLLDQTVKLISEQFNFYHTGIFLLNDNGDYVVLQAASSEGGKTMLERGHRLFVGQQGIVGTVAYENRAHVAMDVGADSSFAMNPDLPLTRAEAAFPLTIRDKVIGVLDIQSSATIIFSQSDVELLQTLADQIALAIQNARLITEISTTLHRLETTDAENVRSNWTERIRQQKQGYRYTPIGIDPIALPMVPAPAGTGNQINIPIALRGQRIGSIILNRKDTTTWNDADRSLAIEVANQIGLALENARLLDDAQRRAAQEQTISELASSFSRTLNPDVLLQTAVKELHRLPNVEEVSVFLGSSEPASSDEPAPEKG